MTGHARRRNGTPARPGNEGPRRRSPELGDPEGSVRSGPGAVGELAGILSGLGCERPLVVCSWRRRRSQDFERVAGALANAPPTFERVEEHLPLPLVEAAWRAAHEAHADAVVSFGGGSAVDLGKALVHVATWGLQGFRRAIAGQRPATHQGPGLRHIAVPTTYSGAQATGRCWVSEGRQKRYVDAGLRPEATILDPVLTLALPWKPTAATGLAALAHAAEALAGPDPDGGSWGQAAEAARILVRNLPEALARPGDMAVRTELLAAAQAAGTVAGWAPPGAQERLANALGVRAGVPYGVANAILLPHVLRHRAELDPTGVARFATAVGAPTQEVSGSVVNLVRDLGLPRRLREVGVFEQDLDAWTGEDDEGILRAAW